MEDSTGRKCSDEPYKHIVWLENVQDSQSNAGSIENMQVHISISQFCLNLPNTVKADNNNSNRRNRIFFMAI